MFPEIRLRRLRQSAEIRKMLDAPLPGPEKFIWPAFVVDGAAKREPIESMPGQSRLSLPATSQQHLSTDYMDQ